MVCTVHHTSAETVHETVPSHVVGEVDDLLHVTDWMRTPSSWLQFEAATGQSWIHAVNTLPLVVSGFSFGSYVGTHLVQRLIDLGRPAERLVMVGSAAGKWELAPVPPDTILIHGELDETIPLIDVLNWARPQELTVQVVPGADHFFHRRLHCIRNIITGAWLGMPDHRNR